MPATEEDIAWFKSTFHPIPKPALPEDCIEYSLYLIFPEHGSSDDSELRLRLRDVQKYANELQKQWLKDYIWQRQGFALELVKEDGEVGVHVERTVVKDLTNSAGLSSLRGRTEYGDSIEDEWVIVWLLRELTKKFDHLWSKVTDSDGEFLLIEASGTIPGWLEPDVAENRVWIHQGQLKIIKPAGATRSSKRTSEKLSLQDARQIIVSDVRRIMHSTMIEEEAFYRLRNYPGQIANNMHNAIMTIPRKVAFLLLQKPAYISPAIEAFYLRDPIALKPLQQKGGGDKLLFPPQDLVTLSIRFPKVGFAQIKSQDFPAPPVWKNRMPSLLDKKEYARADTGMKVTSGIEMLLTDPQHQDKQTVREMKLLLDDLSSGDETLPADQDLEKREKREDDEKWLDISLDDLDRELGGKSKAESKGRKQDFGDKATQENLQRIVKQFEEFLQNDSNDVNGEGMFDDDSDNDEDEDDLDDDDDEDDEGEDKDASFDEEEFSRMMQEMMGMPSDVMKELMSGKIDSLGQERMVDIPSNVRERAMAKVQELDSSDDEDEADWKRMEAELQASGALNLDPADRKGKAVAGSSSRVKEDAQPSEAQPDIDSDFDAQFAKNILASFRSGSGTAGPAASLLSMMGDEVSTSSSNSKLPKSQKRQR